MDVVRRLLAAAALCLAVALTGCTINDANIVGGNEPEQQVIDRRQQAEGAMFSMAAALFIIVPMGLVTLLIAVRGRVTTRQDDVSH